MLHTPTRRLGAAVAATALSAGAMVAMAAPAATAATLSTSYTCTFPVLGAQPVAVAIDAPLLPPTAPAGLDAPALPLTISATLGKPVVDTLRSIGWTSVAATSADMKASVVKAGATVSSADVAIDNAAFPAATLPAADAADGTLKLSTPATAGATTAPFNMPGTGTYAINAPATFTMTAIKQDGSKIEGIPCAVTPGSSALLSNITLSANDATVVAKAKKVKAGKDAKIKVTVSAENEAPTGKVTAMIGSKKVGKGTIDAKGKVTLVVKAKKLKAGKKNNVKLSYAGDDFTAAGKTKVKVTVAK